MLAPLKIQAVCFMIDIVLSISAQQYMDIPVITPNDILYLNRHPLSINLSVSVRKFHTFYLYTFFYLSIQHNIFLRSCSNLQLSLVFASHSECLNGFKNAYLVFGRSPAPGLVHIEVYRGVCSHPSAEELPCS